MCTGLTLIQPAPRRPDGTTALAVSDFFDFSVYLDADENDLHRWYVNRFMTLRQTAFRDPRSFFRKYAEIGEEEALSIAEKLWTGINLPNLRENIVPTRQRASLILTKGASHRIHTHQVAVAHLGQRPTRQCLWRHMDSRGHLAGCTTHTPIRHQRHLEAFALEHGQRGREFVQLGHAVGARALPAHHADDVTVQFTGLEGELQGFL